jgi:hypothetical protein
VPPTKQERLQTPAHRRDICQKATQTMSSGSCSGAKGKAPAGTAGGVDVRKAADLVPATVAVRIKPMVAEPGGGTTGHPTKKALSGYQDDPAILTFTSQQSSKMTGGGGGGGGAAHRPAARRPAAKVSGGSRSGGKPKEYTFPERVVGPEMTQAETFEALMPSRVDAFLAGETHFSAVRGGGVGDGLRWVASMVVAVVGA